MKAAGARSPRDLGPALAAGGSTMAPICPTNGIRLNTSGFGTPDTASRSENKPVKGMWKCRADQNSMVAAIGHCRDRFVCVPRHGCETPDCASSHLDTLRRDSRILPAAFPLVSLLSGLN